MSPRAAVLSAALTAIERAEQPLLAWGVVGGSMTGDEAIELLEEAFPHEDGEELLEEMEFARLIRVLPDGGVRSRSAETVRLVTTLRQWFHKKPWTTAPSLVSDYRFLSSPRGVPDRSTTNVSDLIQQMSAVTEIGPDHEDVIRAVLDGRSVSDFQARSTARLLSTSASSSSTGTVISAGTGAGKTLAFYLPALCRLIAHGNSGSHPQIVAIYPRKELLRDQLASLLETLAGLQAQGLSTPSVGALYGSTPSSREHAIQFGGWRRSGDSLISPVIVCPLCGGDMQWPESRDDLSCAKCSHLLSNAAFKLTRRQIQQRPPDILFTTTEMVNRNLGNPGMKRLFVGDRRSGPRFVLFDEIHTYSGMHGAQVANLVRRWRDQAKHPASFVGLSATLADPIGFFSDLTGIPGSEIVVITPAETEIKEASREYLLVLRGDPVSQTSLLSTTIQTTMLLRRMLDRSVGDPSPGLYGSKVFAFTDDLDVVNRLHYQLQDAEGWKSNGIDQKPSGSLALLRDTGEDSRDREDAGQVWELARLLGTLQHPNRVARTTSQDSGVDPNADTVVATASLEVGFDDPAVGAVVQHKAPRDSAQFIQRRGRAGRNPIMRPWTSVVLSDYGRDRLTFQGYEALSSPVVLPARMPTKNRALLKTQGAWILLDLIQDECGVSTLKYAMTGATEEDRELAGRALTVVQRQMTPVGFERMTWAIQRKLGVDEELARAVIWDPPRALATAVLPTLQRLLTAAISGHDATCGRPPLYEFVPSALFSSLLTPEVVLKVAKKFHPDEDEEFQEPISSALRAFAPGRISFRYALHGRSTRLWLSPPAPDAASLDLSDSLEQVDDLPVPDGEQIERLLHPIQIRLSTPPVDVPDMAYGLLNWRLSVERTGEPLELDIPARSVWSDTVLTAEAFAHRFGSPLQVTRYATSITVDRRTTSDPEPTTHTLLYETESAGLGFTNDVDGLRLTLRLDRQDFSDESGRVLLRALRPSWFEHLALTDPEFAALVPSKFQREWLCQLTISALTSAAATQSKSLAAALATWSDDHFRAGVRSAAQEVFGALPADTRTGEAQPDGLLGDIDQQLARLSVRDWLRNNATALWVAGDGADFQSWVADKYLATIGAGLVNAAQTLCPEHDTNDLRVETNSETSSATGSIHVLEDDPGGSGLVETLIERYSDDPRAFWLLVSASLAGGPGERVDSALRALLAVRSEQRIRDASSAIRDADHLAALTKAWSDLRTEMYGRGLPTDPSVVSAIATRLFRSGSSAETEDLVAELLDRWDEVETSVGVELELRVFAFICIQDAEIVRALESVVGGGVRDSTWALNQIVGLLWNRGARIRESALQVYNPYTSLPRTERLLATKLASPELVQVSLDDPDWRIRADGELALTGALTLVSESIGDFRDALAELLVKPTYLGSLETFPRVVRVQRTHLRTEVTIELRELVQ